VGVFSANANAIDGIFGKLDCPFPANNAIGPCFYLFFRENLQR
jgi:hypothetical protein